MTASPRVWNASKQCYEHAHFTTCPRCKGVGRVFREDDHCWVCDGRGEVALSDTGSGWLRPKHARAENSQLY